MEQVGQNVSSLHKSSLLNSAGKTLRTFDVVITTFQVLASEFGVFGEKNKPESNDEDSDDGLTKKLKKGANKKAGHALFDVKWFRVVIGGSCHFA